MGTLRSFRCCSNSCRAVRGSASSCTHEARNVGSLDLTVRGSVRQALEVVDRKNVYAFEREELLRLGTRIVQRALGVHRCQRRSLAGSQLLVGDDEQVVGVRVQHLWRRAPFLAERYRGCPGLPDRLRDRPRLVGEDVAVTGRHHGLGVEPRLRFNEHVAAGKGQQPVGDLGVGGDARAQRVVAEKTVPALSGLRQRRAARTGG